MKRILLVEPAYRNKYPPLGLMKISTYHKLIGDEVVFCKGANSLLQREKWDRVYIATLFTFSWNIVIRTIKYYLKSVESPDSIFVGGSMATIMKNDIVRQKGFENITVIQGLLDKPRILDDNDYIVDDLIPDYSIIDINENKHLNYEYPVTDAFFIHASRGCVRRCEFCAVPQIEPQFKNYIDIKPKINAIAEQHGEKRNLIIMDNNILASPKFEQIINDIVECGFGLNSNFEYVSNGRRKTKKRYVDFNQGLDARLLYAKPEKMELLSKVAVRPLRIAFDYADDEFVKIYKKCMWLAAENKIKEVSNYILFNYEDVPNDLYKRLEINVLLNQQFEAKGYKTRIWSFPMRFSPIFGEEAKGRKHLGKGWSRKQLRGIQCILNATHGVVGPKLSFFKKAFGEDLNHFNQLIWMPEKYIIYRNENIENGNSLRWRELYSKLDQQASSEFRELIANNTFVDKYSSNPIIMELLNTYIA
jgi:hypothetical protein